MTQASAGWLTESRPMQEYGRSWIASRFRSFAISPSRSAQACSAGDAERPGVSLQSGDGHLRTLQQIEDDIICLAISHYRGNMSEIARHLGIGRSTLYRKLDELAIDRLAGRPSHNDH
jgi:DNA-binding NtrC family response regulator